MLETFMNILEKIGLKIEGSLLKLLKIPYFKILQLLKYALLNKNLNFLFV